MNLPDLYARVVAERPDLAVREDSWSLTYFGEDAWDWTQSVGLDMIWRCEEVSGQIVSALILARWVEALPRGICLLRETPTQWGCDGAGEECPLRPTPIEALAAYYLGDET